MDSLEYSYLITGYEPNAYDLKEIYVESYTESLTPPPPHPHTQFSKQGFFKNVEYDDTALEDMLREAQSTLSEKACLSVSRRRPCSSERSDLLESERSGLLDQLVRSQMLQMHRLELCWTDREQILAECQAEIERHDFQANCNRRSIQKLSEIIESQQEELHRAQAPHSTRHTSYHIPRRMSTIFEFVFNLLLLLSFFVVLHFLLKFTLFRQ